MLSVCYVAFRRILELGSLVFRSAEFKELEIVVFRHQLAVLRPPAPLAFNRRTRTSGTNTASFA